jgi:flagellar biosynthesis/type III secretory pathway M-ring protein FliF/YscJ
MSVRYTGSNFVIGCPACQMRRVSQEKTRVEPFVTIWSDLRGRLTAFRSSDRVGLAIAKGRYESVVQQSIQSMLDDTLGPRRAVARVSTSREKTVHPDAAEDVVHTSVLVLVNSTAGPGAAASQLTPANVQLIRNAVIAAADLNVARGDEVSIELVPFRRDLAPMMRAAQTPVWILSVLGSVALLGTLALLVLKIRSPQPRENGKLQLPAGEVNSRPAIAPAAPATREHMIEYVASVARDNPESIAKLVKLWLGQ